MHQRGNDAHPNRPIADIVGGLHWESEWNKVDEVMSVSQVRDSSVKTATKPFSITIFNYLNIIQLSNNCGLMKYCKSCLTEFSKFTYLHKFY